MKLNYRLRTLKTAHTTVPIVIIHGLFGNLSNLGTIASYLAQYYNIVQIDLRNHGRSPHSEIMTYVDMAQDILYVLDHLLIKKCIVIGHSMGGKVAMTLSILADQRISKIIIIDIAPITYNVYNRYNDIFRVIDDINRSGVQDKNDAIYIMKKNFIKQNMILFLLKSFRKGLWTFNFNSIKKNYININSWPILQTYQGSALFIRGALSSYIDNLYIPNIYHQFPYARISTVPNAGHWVHYDNPVYVLNIINKFILS